MMTEPALVVPEGVQRESARQFGAGGRPGAGGPNSRERGSAALAAVICICLLLLGVVATGAGLLGAAREEAAKSADLAALAGAGRLVLDVQSACPAARHRAVANGADAVACRIGRPDPHGFPTVEVQVSVRVPGWLAPFARAVEGRATATGRARAGVQPEQEGR